MIQHAFLVIMLTTALLFSGVDWNSSATAAPQSVVLYVKPGAGGACTSWADACDLQAALDRADSGDWIWVTEGIYYPTTTGDRSASFQIPHNVELFGGFPQSGSYLEERDWTAHPSVLSGDIGTPDDDRDNSYHVVTVPGTDPVVALDGFTITSGNANETPPEGEHQGGGLFIQNGSLTLNNVTFTNNKGLEGGGMYTERVSANLNNVTFSGNSAMWGGGIYNYGGSYTLNEGTFLDNEASFTGGGMLQSEYSSTSVLNNVTFSGNTAASYGGGFAIFNGNISLTNATIFNNAAGSSGGAVFNEGGSVTLTNGIVWSHTGAEIAGAATVTYSDIEGGWTGTGNIDADPQLTPLGLNGGFSLTHALADSSPAIDAGSNSNCPSHDQRGMPRPIDGDADGTAICDMGAVEYRAATVTTLDSAPDPSLVGQPVQVTVQVTSPLEPPVSGEATVTVDGSPVSCSAVLAEGEGSCVLILPAPRTYTLTAVFPGSGSFGPSQASKTQIVEARVYLPLAMK